MTSCGSAGGRMPLDNWLLEAAERVHACSAVFFQDATLPVVLLATALALGVAIVAARRGCW